MELRVNWLSSYLCRLIYMFFGDLNRCTYTSNSTQNVVWTNGIIHKHELKWTYTSILRYDSNIYECVQFKLPVGILTLRHYLRQFLLTHHHGELVKRFHYCISIGRCIIALITLEKFLQVPMSLVAELTSRRLEALLDKRNRKSSSQNLFCFGLWEISACRLGEIK